MKSPCQTFQLEYVIHRRYKVRTWLHTIYVRISNKIMTWVLQQLDRYNSIQHGRCWSQLNTLQNMCQLILLKTSSIFFSLFYFFRYQFWNVESYCTWLGTILISGLHPPSTNLSKCGRSFIWSVGWNNMKYSISALYEFSLCWTKIANVCLLLVYTSNKWKID
jgi:hypothetical protein